MNPLLDEEQQQLRRTAQEAVEAHVAGAAERIEGDGTVARDVLAELGSAGLLQTAGTGSDRLVETALVVEQVARKSASMASLVASQAAALDALAGAGQSVNEIAAGQRVVAVIVDGLEADGDGRLTGAAPLVCAAAACDEFLVAANGEGAGLYRVPAGADGLGVDVQDGLLGMNGSGMADVTLTAVAGEKLGDRDAARDLGDAMRIALSAVGVGLGRGALDVAVAEVEARKEAGDRIDRSQSVQWMLADMATETEAARASMWHAACAAPGRERDEASGMCRLLSAESAVGATRRALQIFGARGAVRSTGVERLYRDAKVLEMQGGSNEEQLARIARHVLPDLTAEA